jgi:hypothetical protein
MFPLIPKGVYVEQNLNACVGNNGESNFLTYASGYAKNAISILQSSISNPTKFYADEIIYPAAFSIRHSVELRLKHWIGVLVEIGGIRELHRTLNREATHDIGIIWSFVKSYSIEIDRRYVMFIEALDPYISALNAMDNTGQTFRYPKNNKDSKHLINESIISLNLLLFRFIELESIFELLHHFNEKVKDEYASCAFTKSLSWWDLKNISISLPYRENWNSIDFSERKSDIRDSFKISNREFSKALNLIQNDYILAKNINCSQQIDYLSVENFTKYLEYKSTFDKLNDDIEKLGDYLERLFSPKARQLKTLMSQCVKAICKEVPIKEILTIESLYYFQHDQSYSNSFRDRQSFANNNTSANTEELETRARHILDKASLSKFIGESLLLLNQDELVECLVKHDEKVDKNIIKKLEANIADYNEDFTNKVEVELNEILAKQFVVP